MTGTQKMKVAVLMGGVGSEREVSLQSGENAANLLVSEGFEVVKYDITPNDLHILDDRSVDLFFLTLHGEWGEDGQIQTILEQRNLRFTGSDAVASKLSFDKTQSKKCFGKINVPVAFSVDVNAESDFAEIENQLLARDGKFVVKPTCQGSSVGVEIRTGAAAAVRAAKACLEKFSRVMIESFVPGKELTVGIVNGRPLPIIEICSVGGFYDYTAKYLSDETQYLFDTLNDLALENKIKDDAVKCFKAVNARHLARVDFILSEDGEYTALEINTLPGFTSHSLLPKAAVKAGMTQGQLCREIVMAAMNH